MNHDDLLELLPLYVLGALEQNEDVAVRSHLASGCEACSQELVRFESAATEIAFSVQPVTPPPSVRENVLQAARAGESPAPAQQVWKSWDEAGAPDGLRLVRAEEGTWETVSDGVEVKRLSLDRSRRLATMLVRMRAGTSYPSHRHALAEECYVVSGELHVGDDLVMRAGDFQRAEAGSVHVPQWTEAGCLLFITSSIEDELLA